MELIERMAGVAQGGSRAVPPREIGYSGTPLPTKLGLKDGQIVAFVALPPNLARLAEAAHFVGVSQAAGVADLHLAPRSVDLVHAFFTEAVAMREALPVLRAAIRAAGAIWISWPKKAAKLPTDLSEELVRRAALDTDLVDIRSAPSTTSGQG
jgi:hypothetical protein